MALRIVLGAPEQGAGIAASISTIGNLIEKKGKTEWQPDRPR